VTSELHEKVNNQDEDIIENNDNVVQGANRHIANNDTHVGMAAAGLVTGARQLAEITRNEASTYRSDYRSPIPLSYLAQRVSNYKHAYLVPTAL
jgi:20S proteasome alpha/beta subunit